MREQVPHVTPFLRIGGREWNIPNALSALRHPNYRRYCIGQLVSLTGSWMQATAQQWLVLRLTGSPLALGIAAALGSLPILFFSIPAGVLVDRVDKRKFLVACQAAMLVLAVALATLTWTGVVQYWHVLVIVTLHGLVIAFELPARNAFAIEMVGRADLMNAIVLNSSTFNGARLLGPALAGLAIAAVGEELAFTANAVSFLAVIGGLLSMRLPPFVPPPRRLEPWREVREGLWFVAHGKTVLPLIVMAAIPSVFGFPFVSQLPAIAVGRLGMQAEGFGLLSSSFGVGALLAAVSLASLGEVRRKGLLLSLSRAVFAVGVATFALSRWKALSVLALVVAGWGQVTHLATTNTLLQLATPDGLRGRVMGAWTWCVVGIAPFGSLLLGAAAERWSPSAAIFAGAVACALAALAGLRWGRVDRAPTEEVEP